MTVLIGERYRSKLSQSLAAQGIEALWLPDEPALDPRLAGHADLRAFRAGRRLFMTGRLPSHIVSYLTNKGYILETIPKLGKTYPDDVPPCICATGSYTIYDPKTAWGPAAAAAGGIPVRVRQGYTRCAALIADDHSIITADASVSSASKKAGMDVLDITPGHIILDGYDTGFIGGASFIINDTVYFTGTLDEHPDRERIIGFLAKRGKRAVFLTEGPVFDIGGAIPV